MQDYMAFDNADLAQRTEILVLACMAWFEERIMVLQEENMGNLRPPSTWKRRARFCTLCTSSWEPMQRSERTNRFCCKTEKMYLKNVQQNDPPTHELEREHKAGIYGLNQSMTTNFQANLHSILEISTHRTPRQPQSGILI